MRLYLSGISKNGVGYTPDTLLIENKSKRYEYDINGTTDYSSNGLDTRTKGVLYIRNDRKDDYVTMTKRQEKKLLSLLRDPSSTIVISVYPQTNQDAAIGDILSETIGTLLIHNEEVSFRFDAEFYGF